MGHLMDLQSDPDAAMVDPQLSMQYFTNLSGKQNEPMTIDPTLWQTPIDTSQRFDIVQPQGYQPEDIDEELDDNHSVDSPPYATRARTGKATRTDSKSSVPSLTSGSSGSPDSPPSKHTRPKTTKKQDSKASRKKQKTSKKPAVEEYEEDGEDDSKRNKYLERNRVAASKCRQKKKAWVSDLETQKTELERKHSNLQHEYTGLVNEVTQLKNQLMAHAGCNDPRIDGWIETEAKRFVDRTTDLEQQKRRFSAASAPRRPSLSGKPFFARKLCLMLTLLRICDARAISHDVERCLLAVTCGQRRDER